jgi:protein SCO1/2
LAAGGLLAGGGSGAGFVNTDITGASYGKDFRSPTTPARAQPGRLSGKVVTLFFGYVQCPDVCPTNLLNMVEVMKQLGRMPTRCRCCS